MNVPAAGNRSHGRGRGMNANKVCIDCGKVGHTINVCYKKHGFPPNFKFKNEPPISSTHNVFQDDRTDVKHNEEDITTKVKVPQQLGYGLT